MIHRATSRFLVLRKGQVIETTDSPKERSLRSKENLVHKEVVKTMMAVVLG